MPRTPVKMLDMEDGLVDVSSTPYSIAANVGGALVATGGGAITINLPALSSVRDGKVYYFRIVSGTSAVTLDGSGSETVNGAATDVLHNTAGEAIGAVLVARKTGGNAGWWYVSTIPAE